MKLTGLNPIHIYIILKRESEQYPLWNVWIPYIFTSFSNQPTLRFQQTLFESHTYLHHSQTHGHHDLQFDGLNPIHIYIILKQQRGRTWWRDRLNPIHIYIILKPQNSRRQIPSDLICGTQTPIKKFHNHPYLLYNILCRLKSLSRVILSKPLQFLSKMPLLKVLPTHLQSYKKTNSQKKLLFY